MLVASRTGSGIIVFLCLFLHVYWSICDLGAASSEYKSAGYDVSGFVNITGSEIRQEILSNATIHAICSSGQEIAEYPNSGGDFILRNLQEGTCRVVLGCPYYFFNEISLRIEISRNGKYTHDIRSIGSKKDSSKESQKKGTVLRSEERSKIVFNLLGKKDNFVKEVSILRMTLMNPSVILIGISILMFIAVPAMEKLVDEEELSELSEEDGLTGKLAGILSAGRTSQEGDEKFKLE